MARRSGLGKGLSALIPGEATGESDSLLRVVPISHIRPNAYQPRSHFDEESMGSLAASIREVGLLQPVLVRQLEGEEDSYELIAGERRWRAARRAGLQTIPVLVQGDTNDVTSLEQALVENLHREDLNALEEAAAYQELMDRFGRTQEQVAQDVGKSRSHVANSVRLLRLPDQVKQWLRDGKLTAGHARTLLSAADPEAAAREILAGQMSVRQAEQRSPKKTKPGGKPPKDPNLADLEASISNKLGLKIQIIHKGDKGGEVRIAYSSLEQLEEITRRLSRS